MTVSVAFYFMYLLFMLLPKLFLLFFSRKVSIFIFLFLMQNKSNLWSLICYEAVDIAVVDHGDLSALLYVRSTEL